ncbi:hypothetical protein [Actinoplanes sp. DH11]|uniref:hypothetical protein n=1 Tax=Actinoplanes sp. DH11 TaxID=2857011 RepID=UPI001E37C779|nr:hypothetical protein [Actinoplanes sp. DH11]
MRPGPRPLGDQISGDQHIDNQHVIIWRVGTQRIGSRHRTIRRVGDHHVTTQRVAVQRVGTRLAESPPVGTRLITDQCLGTRHVTIQRVGTCLVSVRFVGIRLGREQLAHRQPPVSRNLTDRLLDNRPARSRHDPVQLIIARRQSSGVPEGRSRIRIIRSVRREGIRYRAHRFLSGRLLGSQPHPARLPSGEVLHHRRQVGVLIDRPTGDLLKVARRRGAQLRSVRPEDVSPESVRPGGVRLRSVKLRGVQP